MQTNHQQVDRVLKITLVLNLAVAAGKILLGMATGALAITADGFHSLADSASNVVALIANNLAGRPADDDHPYGHARFETLAAMGIALLLLLTAWETISGVIEGLTVSQTPSITPISFAIMIGTLVINTFVNRYQTRAGKRLNSELLLADAAHTGADIFVTLSVLASMVLVAVLGWTWADKAAALVVVVLILRAAWNIIRRNGSVLVDTAPYTPDELETLARKVPTVDHVVRARSRGAPGAAYIDIDVQVAPETTVETTAEIAAAIEDQLRANLDGVFEVEVHFTPQTTRSRTVHYLERAAM